MVIFITKQMQTGLALTSFQLMKVCSDSGLYLFKKKKKEPNSWTPGLGHICSNHFLPDNYKGFCAKIAIFYFYASIREVCSSFYSKVSYSWMLHNASGFYLQLFLCNSLQIFIFSKHLPLDNRCFLSPSSLISSFHTGTL